jgi:ABC-type glycerol-3-phosphate transport system substrate-binding protein
MKVSAINIILILSLCIYGCGIINFSNPTIHLWTNKEEILPFVEEFNKSQTNVKIEATFMPTLSEDFETLQNKPDLIFYSLPEIVIHEHIFEALNGVLSDAGINKDEVYQNLLKLGEYRDAQKFLPFSFDIPIIVFRKQNEEIRDDFSLSLKDLRKFTASATTVQNKALKGLGFSPLWNQEFLFYTALLFGTDFRVTADNIVVWDENALTSSIAYLRSWINESAGSYSREREFSKKYVYEPMYKLIQDNKFGYYRISYYFSAISEYFTVPQDQRKNLDFRWLTYNNKIAVPERILVFAVPAGAKNSGGARVFLKWVFNPSVQEKMIKIGQVNNYDTFGIANGFSIIKHINEHYLPEYYPLLIGLMPPEEYLVFPNPLPRNWEKIKKETILPWLSDEIAKTGEISSLKEKFK